jgi:hypothetical protein
MGSKDMKLVISENITSVNVVNDRGDLLFTVSISDGQQHSIVDVIKADAPGMLVTATMGSAKVMHKELPFSNVVSIKLEKEMK